jgi:CDP-diacylglycerol---glycerol-3-phosphate 3-phosphatidyltransferase
MLSDLVGEWARAKARKVAEVIAKSGVSPNTLSLLGFLFSLVVAYLLTTGAFLLGGVLVLLASAFDMLDGALARVTGSTSKFGAFLDSSLDRYSEIAIYIGLLAYFLGRGDSTQQVLLIQITVAGSLMVSYTRARAESLNMNCSVGLFARPERIIVLALGLMLDGFIPGLRVALWILAVVTNFTALQRILHVWSISRKSLDVSADQRNQDEEHHRADTFRPVS